MKTAGMIVIGDEILSGRTQDKNISYLGERLGQLGIPLREVRIVPDEEKLIIEAVHILKARYSYVFTTGGIGPTHDDITAQCMAKAFHKELVYNAQALEILKNYYGENFNETRKRLARTPEGASLLPNPISTAPGFYIENVFVMAGVPTIMQGMFDAILPLLETSNPILSKTVNCDIPEGALALPLEQIQLKYPAVKIGSYPSYQSNKASVSLVVRGTEATLIDDAITDLCAMVRALNGIPVVDN